MADTPALPEAAVEAPAPVSTQSQKIDPWNVQGEVAEDGTVKAIDYNKLVDEFGTKLIDKKLLERFEAVTGHKPHRYLRRGIVFSHRELDHILDLYEKGEPFFLYTGRGPSSSSIHLGHTTPFTFTKWLHDVFDVPLIIMLTDDEKYLFSEKNEIADVRRYTKDNAKDIIAVGFDPKKTFIFSDYQLFEEGAPGFYQNVTRVAKRITFSHARATFGFEESTNIGRIHFASIQASASFASSFPYIFGGLKNPDMIPCLIPCAIDQDPYFRLTRDVAARAGLAKPSLIHARFLDALQGPGSKMSASVDSSAIFMTDTANQIKNKINKHAFSGGRDTLELHRQLGGRPEVDVAYSYLTYFLEDDDELESIRSRYASGELLTGELKAMCIKELQAYVGEFQKRRAEVTDEVLELFMKKRPLEWKGNPRAVRPAGAEADGAADAPKELSKSALKKLEKLKLAQKKKEEKALEKAASASSTAEAKST